MPCPSAVAVLVVFTFASFQLYISKQLDVTKCEILCKKSTKSIIHSKLYQTGVLAYLVENRFG